MNSRVYTVITAAGDTSKMFRDAGFPFPRNLVLCKGTEVLVRAVKSYAIDWSRTSVALNQDECSNWPTRERITKSCPGVSSVLVNSGAAGALVSALVAAGDAPLELPLVVAGGDSEIEGGIELIVKEFLSSPADAGTIVFRAQETRWSYVLPGENQSVRQVAEKRVIGPLATTGVFFFRRASIFFRAAEWCLVNNARDHGRFFVSTTLNYLIQEGLLVQYKEIDRSRYQTWSLPFDFFSEGK